MKDKNLIITVAILAILLCVSLFNLNNYAIVFEKNWEIKIPYNSKTEYAVSEAGDGYRYHIMNCSYESISKGIDFKDFNLISSEEENDINDIITNLCVPDNKKPKQIDYYYFTTRSYDELEKVYLLMDVANDNLYLIESFM